MPLDKYPGVNAGYVLELYERYLQNPESVDPDTRRAFSDWTPEQPDAGDATRAAAPDDLRVAVAAANLAVLSSG